MNQLKTIFKIIFKWLAAAVVVVLTILFVIQILLIVHFDKIVENTLKETVKVSTGELYSVEFKKLGINVFTGSIKAKEIFLIPDTAVYNRLKDMKQAPNLLFRIHIPEFKISGVNLYKAYFEKHLELKKIFIKEPAIRLLNNPLNQPKGKPKKDPLDLYPLISSLFKKAGVEVIDIQKGDFYYELVKKDEYINHSLKNLSFNLKNVLIDSTAHLDTTNFFYSENIVTSLKNYSIKLPDSLYTLSLGSASFSTKSSSLKLSKIKLTPRYGKYKFGKVNGAQIDRIEMKINEVFLTDINIKDAIEEQTLIVDEILINKVSLMVFRDKRIPKKPKKNPETPQVLLKNLKTLVDIKKVRIRDLDVKYEELPENGGPPGKVTFDNIFVRITDINNHPEAIRKGQTIWVRAEGFLMNDGFIKAKFQLPLNNSDGTYYYSGTMENLRFKELNSVVKPLASVELKDGFLKKLEFKVTANNEKATGSLRMFYNNLKISLLDKTKGEAGFKEKVGSFIANSFIVESDNPQDNKFRIGKISFDRDKSKFIFNYWWKTLFSGIKPSIGFTIEKQTKIEKLKTRLEIRKLKRKTRKQSRQEKKMAKKAEEASN